MPFGQSLRHLFKKDDPEEGLLPVKAFSNGPGAVDKRHSAAGHDINCRHVVISMDDSLRVRYRKSRAKALGYQKDSWNKLNLIHLKAFENDIEQVMEMINTTDLTYSQNPAFLHFKFPTCMLHVLNSMDKRNQRNILLPIHMAAVGGSLNTCSFLNERIKEEKVQIGDDINYYRSFHPLHFVALYGNNFSHHKSCQKGGLLASVFINNDESCDKLDPFDTTPLHYACMAGNVEVAKVFIQNRADVNAKQLITLTTPLQLACQSGHESLIKLLLVHGGDPTAVDSYGNSALHYATRSTDNPEIMKALLRSIHSDKDEVVCARNFGGITPIRLAVEENRLKITEYLLKHQANHNSHEHETLLVHLAAQKGSPQMVSLLIEHGLSIEERDSRGQTPLHFAAEENRLQLVLELIQNKADVEARDERGFTPFLAAASRDSISVVRELVLKCLFTALSFKGENVVLVAAKNNATKVIKYFFGQHHKDEFKLTVRHMLKQPDIYLNTPLHYVAMTGNVEIFKSIIPYYQDINMRNNILQTSLHIAARYGKTEIARLLLEVSVCSINLVDKNEQTPLFAAVADGSIPMINLLINNGANPMALNYDMKIPLDCAIKDGNEDVIRLLLDELKEDEDEFRKVFPLHDAVAKKQLKALKLILKKKYTKLDQINDEGQTCFDLAIDLDFKDGVFLLLQQDEWERLVRRKYVKSKTKNPHNILSPMQNLILKMPEMARVVLDKCIISSGTTFYNYEFLDDIYICKDPKFVQEVSGRYNVQTERLTPYYTLGLPNEGKLKDDFVSRNSSYTEIIADHPLTLMLHNHRHELLSHDLVQSYITSKWNHSAKWFYYGLCTFHVIFLLFLTWITINIKPESIMTDQEKAKFSQPGECLVSGFASTVFLIFSILLFTVTIIKGLRDWSIRPRMFDVLLFVMTFLASTPVCSSSTTANQWSVLVLLSFVAWFHLLNLIRKIPRFGVYVQMVWHTTVSFVRFSPIFLLFMIPFIVSFHVLLGTERGVASILKTMIRTLVMLTGEFEYEGTVKDSFLIYFMFFLFIFIGSVFLMNLLVGLAVSDTNKTLEAASRTRRRLQIETIHHVEVMMPEAVRRKLWVGFRKVTPGGNSLFILRRLSYWFRWLGLPKDSIKGFFSEDTPVAVPQAVKTPKHKSKEDKAKRNEELDDIRISILQTQSHLSDIQSSLNDLINRLKDGASSHQQTSTLVSTPTRKTHELRMIDEDDD